MEGREELFNVRCADKWNRIEYRY